ncbi:tumor necrosis factor ligand superfamily member 13B-like isoform X2 [Ambystoma mexicanum]|uniref:tumor necrosis factor ligand superfamily member 13B-like isoform X2 n=1 Tax=Ambystoma mexicanum TaxID=8296 RepID=UPI0037E9791C
MRTTHLSDHEPKEVGGLVSQRALLALALAALSVSVLLMQQVTSLQEELRQLGQDMWEGNASSVRSRPLPVIKELVGPDLLMINSFLYNQSFQAPLHGGRSHARTRRDTGNFTSQQPFIQVVPAESRTLLLQGDSTLIPWTLGLRQGEALDLRHNRLVVVEDSYYLVFGQVLYQENGLPMGHLIQRRKLTALGLDLKILLRCVKNMPVRNSNTSCYTAGVVKLERGDELELIIADRSQAQVSMDGDSTFFGAIQLA